MPDISPYQSQVSASNQTRVGRVEQQAAQPDIGEAIAQFGQKLETARAKSEIVRSESDLRRAYDGIYRELEQDGEGDYSKFEDRFNEKAKEIRAKVLGSLKTETARNLMGERAVGMEDNYAIQVRSLQRARGVAEVQSTVAGKIDEFKEAADNTSLPIDRLDALRKETDAYVADMHRTGFVDDVGMEKYKQDADKLYDAGRVARARDVLDAAETDQQATQVFDQFSKQSEKDDLKTYWKSVQSDRRTKQNIAEAEQRKAEMKAANEFEMGILTKGFGYRALQKAVDRKEISVNDQPALWRSVRAEEDRRRIEAERPKLSPAEKQAWEDFSKDKALGFDVLASQQPALFMSTDNWPQQYKDYYAAMTPDDQRAVEKKRLEMILNGKTSNAVDAIYQDLWNEAKRVAPNNWFDDNAKGKSPRQFALEARLYEAAKRMSPDQGGKPITPDMAKQAVVLALAAPFKDGEKAEWKPDEWAAAGRAALELGQVRDAVQNDPGTFSDVWSQLKAKNGGKDPTAAEALAAYNAVTGK